MLERWVELRIRRIPLVFHVRELDARLGEERLVEVLTGTRAGEVMRRARGAADADEPGRLRPHRGVVGRPGQRCSNAEDVAHLLEQTPVDQAQPRLLLECGIRLLEAVSVAAEMRSSCVAMNDRLPVPLCPAGVGYDRLVDRLVVAPFHAYRNGEPDRPALRLDPVAVSPVAARELAIVVE